MACVSLAACRSYEPAVCRTALENLLAPLGGLDWVRPGMNIAVKLNLVSAMKPDSAATTHPVLVTELVKLLTEKGARVTLGDSPGGLYNAVCLNRIYDVTGMTACQAAGAVLNDDFSVAQANFPGAAMAKSFPYTAWLDGADAIIDFCKLKTHGQMGMTCAVKNFFGTIPGTMKPEYHYKYPRAADFADMLVDLYEYFRPRLCICDGIVGMEGNGPTAGTPREYGVLLASDNGHALDMAAAEILSFAPREVPTLAAAMARGLCPASLRELTVAGSVSDFVLSDVKKTPAQGSMAFLDEDKNLLFKAVGTVVRRVLEPFPKLHPELCIGCGKCAALCPAKTITMQNGLPRIRRKDCIHCFCCQEFCPKGAMQVGRSAIARLISR